MTVIVFVLMALSVVGLLLTTALTIETVLFLRRCKRPFGRCPSGNGASRQDASTETLPHVSILKPLCGLEDGLEENLESFAKLLGVRYEVICSVADSRDPAIEVYQRVKRRFPGAPFRIVVGNLFPTRATNRKVERLVQAAQLAKGSVFYVSDANVRVGDADIAQTLLALSEPGVGCVSNCFAGEGAQTAGAAIEALHLMTFVVPGNVLAALTRRPCLVGKSFAIPRSVHDAMGGFEPFGEVLAEDQAMALAITRLGWRIAYSPVVVSNIVRNRTVMKALDRQMRWGKIRFSFSRSLFAGEFVLMPFALNCLSLLMLGLDGPPEVLRWAAALTLGTLLCRFLQTLALDQALGRRLPLFALALIPVADLLQFGAQFAPFLSREIEWHGFRARLGPQTKIEPLSEEQLARVW